jgi:hypothetical protein
MKDQGRDGEEEEDSEEPEDDPKKPGLDQPLGDELEDPLPKRDEKALLLPRVFPEELSLPELLPFLPK